MKRRIVICGLFKYPRGNACANYMQYLSDALQLAGYEVTLICCVNKEYAQTKEFTYHGAKVMEIMHQGPVHLFNRLMNGKLFKLRFYHLLKSLKLTSNDLVITSDSAIFVEPILTLRKLNGFRVCGYLLEWFPREHYDSKKKADKAERCFRKCGSFDLLFPISHHIADQFEEDPTRVLVLPIMADTSEYPFIPKEKKPYEFILPAMGMMKDALDSMMLALSDLSDAELASFKFHITGVKRETVKGILGEDWLRVENTLIFHSWMKYEELIALYRRCHYLFLARDVNQMTLSNFPSKVPETMTHGIVPVCSDVGDYTKYYLTDSVDSLIFKGCSREVCATALRRALAVSEEQYHCLSRNARNCVEKRFDYHNWVDALQENIEAVFTGD